MQRFFSEVKTTLWITSGANDTNPYHPATIGLGRAVWGKQAELRLHFLDIDHHTNHSTLMADVFLRLKVSTSDDFAHANPLWSTEREFTYQDGRLLLPRMLPDTDRT